MRKDMTIGNPMKIILLFSLPVLLGNLFQQFYNMVDTVIVGQYLGEDALAAVGSTGCLMFLVLGFANGIAQGFGVMVSHAFGAKDMKLLRHCVALSLLLTVVISMILTVPTVAFSRQLLLWLNTPENILTLANRYIRVIFAGIFATMAYNVASGILRGIGDSRTPLYFLILSSGLNIFLDIFLIVVVKLGTAGAAYATVISQAVSAVLCFIVMFRKYDILRTTREDYYCDFHEIRRKLVVVFGDTLAEILRNARKEQLKNRMQYGELYHKNYYREVKDKNRVYYEFYHLDGTENVPEDYKEISFVCLRPDGSLELPSTLGIVCRKIAQKLDGFEGFHFHQFLSNLPANNS